jgi:hypothetical protein
MCEESTVEVRVQRARAIKTRERVRMWKPKSMHVMTKPSQYHLRMYCETAQLL